MQIPDYYEILEIDRDATAPEIKQAFRKLAKRYHPDKYPIHLNPEQVAFAKRMFSEVYRAYAVLRDEKRKWDYDRTLQAVEHQRKAREAYLDKLSKLSWSYAKLELLFQALLHQNYETGISVYEELLCQKGKRAETRRPGPMNTSRQVRIDDFLSYEESRDCEFLIAEAYQKVGKREQAMAMYESLLVAEAQRPCFRHFTRELKERLKWMYLYHFSVEGYQQMGPVCLTKIRTLQLPKRETAWMYKKIAEFYVEINRFRKARQLLHKAFELHPQLSGAKKICQKLNMVHLVENVQKE